MYTCPNKLSNFSTSKILTIPASKTRLRRLSNNVYNVNLDLDTCPDKDISLLLVSFKKLSCSSSNLA